MGSLNSSTSTNGMRATLTGATRTRTRRSSPCNMFQFVSTHPLIRRQLRGHLLEWILHPADFRKGILIWFNLRSNDIGLISLVTHLIAKPLAGVTTKVCSLSTAAVLGWDAMHLIEQSAKHKFTNWARHVFAICGDLWLELTEADLSVIIVISIVIHTGHPPALMAQQVSQKLGIQHARVSHCDICDWLSRDWLSWPS